MQEVVGWGCPVGAPTSDRKENNIIFDKFMTNNRFRRFCLLEYGLDLKALVSCSAPFLYELILSWYECPEFYCGPSNAMKTAIETEIKKLA